VGTAVTEPPVRPPAKDGAKNAPAEERSSFTLANGLRVRLVPSRENKKVVVLLGVRAGFFEEPAGISHLAHVAEHLTVFGLPAGSEEAKAVDQWYQSGKANAETLADMMYFDLHVTPEELPLALRVQASRLARAEFTPEVLAREIPRTLSEVEFVEKSEVAGPAKFAWAAFVQAALYGQLEIPLKAKTRAITLENVRDFHKRTFHPDRAILYVVGDFDPATTRTAIEATFDPISKSQPSPNTARPQPKSGVRKARWDISTHHLILGWPTPPASHPDHAALTLAGNLLMQHLYMDNALMSQVKMPLATNEVEGLFLINVQLKPKVDPEALQDKLLEHVARLTRPDGLRDLEVALSRKRFAEMVGPVDLDKLQLPPNYPKIMARANIELQKMMNEIAAGDLAAYAHRVEALNAAAVREAIARHLDPKNVIVVRLEPMK
jgi:predicted Zn-dependent peptidase